MARKTKEEAEITRNALLKAAVAVFGRQGYSATRLEDIAAEAGVTRGSIYHHFGSKVELYNEMLVHYSKPIQDITEASIREGGTISDMLRRLFIRICTAVEDDEDLRAIQEITLTKTELTPEMAEGMMQKSDSIAQWLDTLIAGIREGIESGELRRDLDSEDATVAYYSFFSGYLLFWILNPSAFSIKARAPYMIDLFMKGLLPNP